MDDFEANTMFTQQEQRLAALEARLNAIDRLLTAAVQTMEGLAATDSSLLDTAKALAARIDGVEALIDVRVRGGA